jgi:hypothetical protein
MASKIIKQIIVRHNGEFIVDTLPPEGSVLINDGDPFTNSPTVNLKLEAVDATTDVKDMDIRNVDVTRTEDGSFIPNPYPFQENISFTNEMFWNITPEDGYKRVDVRFRDYAGNVSEYSSSSSVSRLWKIDGIAIDAESALDNVYVASQHTVYAFDGSGAKRTFLGNVVDLQNNFESIYIAVNSSLQDTSEVYLLLDRDFTSLNTFDSHITDMASYNNELYVILENGELYKKDSSAWFLVATIPSDVAYIDGESDYLYIVLRDETDAIIYNGESFAEVVMIDPNLQLSEDESSSDSSSSNSSSSTELESSISTEGSSSSTEEESESSLTVSTSSDSSVAQNSSSSSSDSSSLSLLSSSSQEFIGGDPSSSDDTFDISSSSINDESSSESSSDISEGVTSSSIPSDESSSSGDPCFCREYLEDSLYVKNFKIDNLTDKYVLDCNFYGRMVILSDKFARVYIYHSEDRKPEDEVARSIDFYWKVYPQVGVPIVPADDAKGEGSFDYIIGYNRTNNLPHEFTLVCDEREHSESSDFIPSSDSSNSLDLMIGNGTEESPYRIRTCRDLQVVRQDPTAYYVLDNDIDCIETFGDAGGFTASDLDALYSAHGDDTLEAMYGLGQDLSAGFNPIGTMQAPWGGNFDGKCFAIRNLYINKAGSDYVGLFGYTDGAYIKDVSLRSFEIQGNDHVGAFVGYAVNSTIEGVEVVMGVPKIGEDINLNVLSVLGSENVGGIAGSLLAGSSLNDSSSRVVNVKGNNYVGGLVGYRQRSASIADCYSNEYVNGFGSVGGLVGSVGSSGPSGGGSGEVISSYWNVEVSGVIDSADGDGKSDSEMKSSVTYVDWDFEETWKINGFENDGYPFLICNAETDQSSSSSDSSSSEVPDPGRSSQSSGGEESSDESSSSQSQGIGVMARWTPCVLVAQYENCNLTNLEANKSQGQKAVYKLCDDQGVD